MAVGPSATGGNSPNAPRRRRRGGCCCCCLVLLLAPVVLLLVVLFVSWAGPRLRRDPVEREWKSVPGYFDTAAPAAAPRRHA